MLLAVRRPLALTSRRPWPSPSSSFAQPSHRHPRYRLPHAPTATRTPPHTSAATPSSSHFHSHATSSNPTAAPPPRAQDLDVDTLAAEAKAAEAKAAALGDDNAALSSIREVVAAAREKHATLEDASSEVVLLATPRPIDDYAAVDIALGKARQVGAD